MKLRLFHITMGKNQILQWLCILSYEHVNPAIISQSEYILITYAITNFIRPHLQILRQNHWTQSDWEQQHFQDCNKRTSFQAWCETQGSGGFFPVVVVVGDSTHPPGHHHGHSMHVQKCREWTKQADSEPIAKVSGTQHWFSEYLYQYVRFY